MLLLILEDLSLNPGLLRSIWNKGQLLADMVALNDLDFFCLTEIHIHPFDLDSFIWCITPPDFIFLTGLVPQDPPTNPLKLNLLPINHLRI